MMSYFGFQLKKITKHNLTIIALCILIIISFGVLFLNTKQIDSGESIKGQIQGNIVIQKNNIAQDKQALKKYSPTGEGYRQTKIALKQTKKQLQVNQALIEHINKGQWGPVYKEKIKEINKMKTTELSERNLDFVSGIKKRYQYLVKHPLPYESDAAVTGLQFWLDLNGTYWPILFTLVIIFILTYLYTDAYKNGLDITTVLPINVMRKQLSNSLVGLAISCLLYLLLSLLVFTGASLIFGTGNLQYPAIIHHLVNRRQIVAVAPLATLIPQILILQFLEFIFLVLFIQLLAKLLHNQLPTLLLAVLLVVGIGLATTVIEPLAQIAQWLPNTYLNAINVVSGVAADNLDNYHINFTSGVGTLLIGSLVLFSLICLLERTRTHHFKEVEVL
ncbi:hypothetical protein [Lactobacillus bombicola]|uniref:ABC transporter permease n=1 Tax=Lactobacillus bombicola TaxID=1505723 RepID=A0ABX9LUF0_9LACO|nr:hypothetical protein [Lactobacillus bombicola]RHW51403.1 hypothetical protein DS834_04565 [Lactobacillus bombicola]RHW52564.1 hypothetical protein DS833_01395 [Lactobacillus bombicola]